MQALIILFLILAILLVIFTLQNTMGITIHLFFWQIINAPLALVVLICIVIGYALAAVYFIPKVWKLKSERNRLTKLTNKLKETGNSSESGQKMKKDDSKKNNPEGIRLDEGEDNSFFTD